jgi:transcriptional regulator ATRX
MKVVHSDVEDPDADHPADHPADPESGEFAEMSEYVKRIDSKWFDGMTEKDYVGTMSAKIYFLLALLTKFDSIGDKCLIFSQKLENIACIIHFLTKYKVRYEQLSQENAMKMSDNMTTEQWAEVMKVYNFNDMREQKTRDQLMDDFNREDINYNHFGNIKVLICPTASCGMGITLTGANRVIMFDMCWNPSLDKQAIKRVYRYGQTKVGWVL